MRQGVINLEDNGPQWQGTAINLVDDTPELMLISQIRQDHPHRHQNCARGRPFDTGCEAVNLEEETGSRGVVIPRKKQRSSRRMDSVAELLQAE